MKDHKLILKRILSYLLKYKLSILGILVFSIIESIITVWSPKLSGKGITALSAVDAMGNPNIDIDYIFKLFAFLIVLYSINGICSCLSRYLFTNVSIKMIYNLRQKISIKINKISFKYVQEKSQGDILSCVVSDVETLGSCFIESLKGLISSAIIAFGTIFMMISISKTMTLVSLIIIPIMFIVTVIIIKKSQKYFVSYRKNLGKFNSYVEESFLGFETLKSFNAEKKVLNEFKDINAKLYHDEFKCQFFSGIISPIMEFSSKIVYVLCCVVGGYLAAIYKLAIGDITAFIAYSQQFINPLIGISSAFSGFQAAFAAAERIFEFLDAPEEIEGSLSLPSEIKNIEFRNVSFKYGEEKSEIKNISFKINSGETVAIVGETGCGKTTIFKLLMRFYDVDSGKILINSENIKNFKLDEYRKLFGIVTQDSWLYNATIRENITYGNLKASKQEIETLTEAIGIKNFIKNLPYGYETVIEEEMKNISQGQKQLICVARALISKCKILILDESTASVDTFTESLLEKYLNSKSFKNKINIIIAHRLSSIRNADKILVINEGQIVEHGTHEELIKRKQHYYFLYKHS